MYSGLFRSQQPAPTRIENFPELKEALLLIKKLHKKERELRKSAQSNGPNSIDHQKFIIITTLLEQVDKIITEFNEGSSANPQQEMSDLVTAIHKLFTLVANSRRTDDHILMMLRNKNREIASKVVYCGTFAVTFITGTTVFFSPLGTLASLVYAPHASKAAGEFTGLNDLSAESMRLINQLYKELNDLDQQYKRKYYSDKENKDEEIDDFLCPINKTIMVNPVVCKLDGASYEKEAIEKWLSMKRTSPLNRERIPTGKTVQDVIATNRNLKSVIARFLTKNPTANEEDFVVEEKPSMVILKN